MRRKFENGFEAWAGIVARGRHGIVLGAVVLTGIAAAQLPKIELDTSTESYLLEDDPARLAYDDLREQFGRDQVLVIALEPPEIFDLDFLAYLRDVHDALEERLPYLERITSLINIRSVEGRGDRLVVGDLIEDMPADAQALEALRRRVLSTPSYRDTVISADGRVTAIVVESDAYSREAGFDPLEGFTDADFEDGPAGADGEPRPFLTPTENGEIVEAAKAILAEFERPDVVIHLAGSPMLTHEVTLAMLREIPIFFGGSLLVIAVALFVLFRRLLPCLAGLLIVTMSVVTTLGTAVALGRSMSILSQILPSFLLAVGLGYSVHLFSIYFQRLDAGDDKRAALVAALRHSGPPILMTALTTVAGLASFLVAIMPPLRDFGSMAMVGVAWTLLFNLTLLPALMCILPMRGREGGGGAATANRFLIRVGTTAARHPWKVVAAASALAIASGVSAARVQINNNPIEYLAPETPYRVAHNYIDDRLGGSSSIELFMDAGEENALYEPEVMNRLEALDRYIRNFEFADSVLGETTSVLDITKETHQALNANDPTYYAVPQTRALLAQELLLFENSGSEDLERVVDPQFQLARFSIRTEFRDGNFMARVVRKLNTDIPEILAPHVTATITGANALIARTVEATSLSLLRTYALALAVITPLMMILIGSLRAGLVSMAPNLLPILFTVGMMPLLRMPLDLFTMMLGCIAIGLAVDDTLHFIHGFRARLDVTNDPYRAIEETLSTTGRALLFTSIVLSTGFLVLTFSSMSNLRALGGLTALSISAAFILDIIVTPALLVLVTRRGEAAAAPERAA